MLQPTQQNWPSKKQILPFWGKDFLFKNSCQIPVIDTTFSSSKTVFNCRQCWIDVDLKYYCMYSINFVSFQYLCPPVIVKEVITRGPWATKLTWMYSYEGYIQPKYCECCMREKLTFRLPRQVNKFSSLDFIHMVVRGLLKEHYCKAFVKVPKIR